MPSFTLPDRKLLCLIGELASGWELANDQRVIESGEKSHAFSNKDIRELREREIHHTKI